MVGTTTGSVFLLGILRDVQAIVHLQRTVLDPARAAELVKEGFESIDVFLDNRPVGPRSYPPNSLPL